MLNCTNELYLFYKLAGFEALSQSSKQKKNIDIINHYDEIKETIPLETYILKPDTIIDHQIVSFIKCVIESVSDVNFKENVQVFNGSLVDEIHDIVATPDKYNKMTNSCSA